MAYIGNNLQAAFPSYVSIDDISGSFNGVTKSFALKINGSTPVPFPINPQQCLISVNGVIQKPDPSGVSGFNLVGSNIVFASAPTGGWAFFGVVLAGADYINVGVKYPDGTVGAPSITFTNALTTGLYLSGPNQLSTATGGILRQAYDASGRSVYYSATVGNVLTLTDASTITPDFSLGNNFAVTLGGNRQLANPTNLVAGQTGIIVVTQDATGSRSLTFGSYWKFPSGTAPTLTTTASAVDLLPYYVESTTRISARLIPNTK